MVLGKPGIFWRGTWFTKFENHCSRLYHPGIIKTFSFTQGDYLDQIFFKVLCLAQVMMEKKGSDAFKDKECSHNANLAARNNETASTTTTKQSGMQTKLCSTWPSPSHFPLTCWSGSCLVSACHDSTEKIYRGTMYGWKGFSYTLLRKRYYNVSHFKYQAALRESGEVNWKRWSGTKELLQQMSWTESQCRVTTVISIWN